MAKLWDVAIRHLYQVLLGELWLGAATLCIEIVTRLHGNIVHGKNAIVIVQVAKGTPFHCFGRKGAHI